MATEKPLGRPLQVVKTGDVADNYSFTLEEENLDHILSQVPDGMKVSVVSVVGAFRTGKSFLLSFFLRYLHSDTNGVNKGLDWIRSGGEALREGNANLGMFTGDGVDSVPMSFAWRGGQQRMTTGIWMWSEPFVRQSCTGEKVAVLLVDTQGMFDNETSMGLTASIFGLSTLISNHQIYNVEKRIQEDHLQQLALFSEYGRMALARDGRAEDDGEEPRLSISPSSPPNDGGAAAAASTPAKGAASPTVVPQEAETDVEVEKPFQLLEFLVRDWQNFDDGEDVATMEKEMDEYLKDVIKDRNVTDLQATRDQIMACFEKVRCFGLCHPGMEVVKKTYDGNISKIDPLFCKLLDAYARSVFNDTLEPKRIHGRHLTAPELRTYIAAYVKLFHDGATFPEAKTLLEATSAANNSNAKFAAVARYKSQMEQIAGPSASEFLQKPEFEAYHEESKGEALALFNEMANMGRAAAIKATREQLEDELSSELQRYEQVNESRRPFKNMEYYLIPMAIAAAAFILRTLADASCSSWSTTCKRTSEGLGHIYVVIFLFVAITSAGRIKQFMEHLKNVLPLLLGAGGQQSSTGTARQLVGLTAGTQQMSQRAFNGTPAKTPAKPSAKRNAYKTM